jgi:hypothetical protein
MMMLYCFGIEVMETLVDEGLRQEWCLVKCHGNTSQPNSK